MDKMFENEVRIMKKLRNRRVSGMYFRLLKQPTKIGFPRIEAYGQVDNELGYIAMEILGANSLDLMRKVEVKMRQQKKVYGLPMPLVVTFARKLVSKSLNVLHLA